MLKLLVLSHLKSVSYENEAYTDDAFERVWYAYFYLTAFTGPYEVPFEEYGWSNVSFAIIGNSHH
jgi:hypothetical protein